MDDRKVYLAELKTLMSKKGGNMFTGYIQKIRDSAIASVPEKDRPSLQYLMGDIKSIDISNLPKAKGPGVVWTVDDALKMLKEEPLVGRSLANGKKMFSAGLCVACHRFGNRRRRHRPRLDQLGQAQRLQVDPRIHLAAQLGGIRPVRATRANDEGRFRGHGPHRGG